MTAFIPKTDLEIADLILDLLERELQLSLPDLDIEAPDNCSESDIFDDLCDHLGLSFEDERDGESAKTARKCAAWFCGKWNEMALELDGAICASASHVATVGADFGINDREIRLGLESIVRQIREEAIRAHGNGEGEK